MMGCDSFALVAINHEASSYREIVSKSSWWWVVVSGGGSGVGGGEWWWWWCGWRCAKTIIVNSFFIKPQPEPPKIT